LKNLQELFNTISFKVHSDNSSNHRRMVEVKVTRIVLRRSRNNFPKVLNLAPATSEGSQSHN
jgi:hypothetical protein